jgi:hypothetical protein
MASDRQMARYAPALTQAGFVVCAGGMAAGLLELAMWWGNQYWPFATLTKLIGTCTACDSGLAPPFTSWLWSQSLRLLVACTGLALMLLGMALRREE